MIDKNEMIFVVDEKNRPVKPHTRYEAHKNKLWHRTAHIWIRNRQNQILCQRRSLLKDHHPGYWEGRLGGHLPPDTEYVDGALAELEEELGLSAPREKMKFWQVFKYQDEEINNYEFQAVYLLNWDGDITKLKLEADEVDEITWVDLDQLKVNLFSDNENKWRVLGYEKDFFKWVEHQPWGS